MELYYCSHNAALPSNENESQRWPEPGVTFSDSDSAPVPKFLNPDPEIFQI